MKESRDQSSMSTMENNVFELAVTKPELFRVSSNQTYKYLLYFESIFLNNYETLVIDIRKILKN